MQVTPQKMKVTDVERIQGYRFPAPGSQPQPKIPIRENEDALFSNTFYGKDPRNLPNEVRINLNIMVLCL